MIPAGMPNTSDPLPPEFFINLRCPPSASSDPSVIATIREEPPTLSPLAAVDEHICRRSLRLEQMANPTLQLMARV